MKHVFYSTLRFAALTAAGAVAVAGGLVLADAATRWLHPEEYPAWAYSEDFYND